ncbi:MAG: cytochrome c maturation protein CcmE [Rhodospirillales bacterium]|nr:cytochrome c maturation protein CcmE [Rhodospirillales bacterium]MCC7168627.1 cytochrome c maturation protein CcmE [Rhodospirillales bacterium]
MTPRKKRRLMILAVAALALFSATALVLTAFEDNIVFFYSPTDLTKKTIAPDRRLRVGGLVEEGSVKRTPDNKAVQFRVTDLDHTVPVVYGGLLPDLFREGQGVVAEGKFINGVFQASEVLAKHDEKYMPREVADALKKSGQWAGEGGKTSAKPAGGQAAPEAKK